MDSAIEIQELVTQGPEKEPCGMIFLNGRQVGIYRCVEEKGAILHELDEQLSLTE